MHGTLPPDLSNDSIKRETSHLQHLVFQRTGDEILNLTLTASKYLGDQVRYVRLFTWAQILAIPTMSLAIYLFSLVFYRLYLSPIAAFPGPFLARTTHWYEFYYNYIRTGRYYKRIAEMHEIYGEFYGPIQFDLELKRLAP
jgi:hypothetical protein